jgi:glycosyltransferase involved in cell wall biosynthesis
MHILQVNSKLSKGGGPQSYMQQATALLRAHGHQVSHFGMLDEENKHHVDAVYYTRPMELLETAHSSSIRERVGGVSRALWSGEASQKIQALLASRDFDLAHIHNIRYELSPSILPRLKQKGLPVIQTLHDYSLICPRGCFYSERIGKCEKCHIYRYYQAPLTRCIKGSFSRSMFAAIELMIHRGLRIIEKNVDLFIAPSNFIKNKFIAYGVPESQIYYLPNSVDVKPNNYQEDSGYCTYVGALRKLKGIYTLLDAAERLPSVSFIFIGEGEELDHLRKEISVRGLSNAKLLGHLSGQALVDIVSRSRMIILPSEWYENCPMVILEAYAQKKPVIGARIGGIPELVDNNITGLLFAPADVDELVEKIVFLYNDTSLAREMGEEGRERLERDFNVHRHYDGLMEAYRLAEEKSGYKGHKK